MTSIDLPSLTTLCGVTIEYDSNTQTITTKNPLTCGEVIRLAKVILAERVASGDVISSPSTCRDFIQVHYAGLEREQFGCLFLDSKHRLIAHEVLFYGTIDTAKVHPREVVKRALALNAAAVIAVHNHPSGEASASSADIALTDRLSVVLGLMNIRLLDHMIVGNNDIESLAELGKLNHYTDAVVLRR